MNKINNNEALTFELLRRTLDVEMLKLNENKISYEKLEKNILQLKKYLPIEVLKEMRIPNNHIIEFLQHIKFTEKFQQKEIKDKKIKI